MHHEMEGKEMFPIEEIKFLENNEEGIENKKEKGKKRDMARYFPLIFEECYVKHKGLNRVANTFELESDPELAAKIDPTLSRGGSENTYSGLHLFVLCHGF
jgi:hypothetical protein